ncbi:hypothetical protein B4U80_12737 [Leptotrombidium deliense]|uniref:BHLH domain-containing protein n=1 Tax=Leptotrombidium deliense TaxID=299467 RepID=A0A443SNY5_9ACAR|nr:hypothetical protein B4U80_12737 [Leptotrombidium deliense]
MSPSKKNVENDVKAEKDAKDKQLSSSVTHRIRDEVQRKIHNGVEKKRKDKINTWINKIGELLPLQDPKKDSKNGILERTYNYIIHLKETNEKLMLGHVSEVQESELQQCRKRVKELEVMISSYYKLLRTAGISACVEHVDLWKHRPTKYSNKISEDQINSLVKNNKDEPDDSSSSESSMNSTKKLTTNEESIKCQPNTSVSTNTVVVNDSTVATVSENKSRNPQIQIRPTSNVQLLPNAVACDNSVTNNLVSGQIIIGHTVLNAPPQPQATALLLPNGQIVSVVSQSQPSLLFSPGTGLVLTSPQVNQLTTVSTNLSPNVSKPTTTTVEIVPASPEPQKAITKKKKTIKRLLKNLSGNKKPVKNENLPSKGDGKCEETKDENTKSEGCTSEKRNKAGTDTELITTESDILAKATESIFSPRSSSKSDETASNANNEKQDDKNVVSEQDTLQKDKLEKNETIRNDELSNNEGPPSKRYKITEALTDSEKSATNIAENSVENDKPETNAKNAIDNNRLMTTENNTEIFADSHRNEENLGGDQDSELPSILGLTEDNVISPDSVNSIHHQATRPQRHNH